ncbi:hypothetical protein QAD02_011970, partial [Eretmocerus hayati]
SWDTMMRYPTFVINFLTITCLAFVEGSLETVYQWKYFDFVWPSESVKEQAIIDGSYNYSVIRPYDIDVSQDGRVFMSFPFFNGNPARFGYVTDQKDMSGPLIQPYPDWDWFNGANCDHYIIAVVRFKIDQCNRLWLVNTARPSGLSECPSKLMVFHLSNDTLLWQKEIPDDIVFGSKGRLTYITTLIIDSRESDCKDAVETIAQDTERFNFISGMKIVKEAITQEEVLWVIASRSLQIHLKKMDFSKTNFYLTRSPVKKLIKGSKCENPRKIADAPQRRIRFGGH